MASRYRSLSKSGFSLFKATLNKPTLKPNTIPSLSTRSSLLVSSFRRIPQLGALQSLLPLHSAVSSARLTSCLGIDSSSSRSLSQGRPRSSLEVNFAPAVKHLYPLHFFGSGGFVPVFSLLCHMSVD